MPKCDEDKIRKAIAWSDGLDQLSKVFVGFCQNHHFRMIFENVSIWCWFMRSTRTCKCIMDVTNFMLWIIDKPIRRDLTLLFSPLISGDGMKQTSAWK